MATTVLERLAFDLGINLKEFNAKIGSARSKLKGMGKTTAKIGAGISAGLGLPLIGVGALALKASIDFESAFTGVKKTVSATEEEFEELKKGIIKLSETLPMSAVGLSAIAEAAGQLGIERENILGFTEVMANLGNTTNLTADNAASMLAKFANITQLSADEYENLGSTIVDLGNNFATTENDIVRMAMRLAGAGKTIGLSQANILALAAGLSSVGIEAEAGGTAFSQVMKKISKEIGSGSEKMEEFAQISGQSVAQFEAKWKVDAAGALIDFTEGLARVQEEGENVNVVLDSLGFEGIRVSDSLLRAAGSGDLFREALAKGNTAWEENIALTNEAELRYGTTQSQLDLLKNRFTNLSAKVGEVMIPVLLKLIEAVDPIIDMFKELSPETLKWGIILGGLIAIVGPLLIGIGGLVTLIGAISAPVAIAIAGIAALTAGFFLWKDSIVSVWTWVKKLLNLISGVGGAIGGFILDQLGIGGGGTVNNNSTSNTSSTNVFINEQVSRSDVSSVVTESERQEDRS